MAAKEQARHNDQARSEHSAVRLEAQSAARQDHEMASPIVPQKARIVSRLLMPHDLLQLQRTIGNRAVSNLFSGALLRPVIQANREVGLANDHYEQGSDRVAAQARAFPALLAPIAQRAGQADEAVQAKLVQPEATLHAGEAPAKLGQRASSEESFGTSDHLQRQVHAGDGMRHTGHALIQRDVEPGDDDPLTDMMTKGSKSLLYGASSTRKHTSLRLQDSDQKEWATTYRTIDAYNDAIGLSDLMKAPDPSNIFKVREALAALQPDDVAGWGGIITPQKVDYAKDDDLVAWLKQLQAQARWIGLYDFGAGKPGLKRIKAKHRYQKNFISKSRYKGRSAGISPKLIQEWLADRTFTEAEDDKKTMPKSDQSDLGLWIAKAFWRRTSKLGIDFTIGRGHKIHMNTAADKNFGKTTNLTLKAGALKKIKENYGRMITTSEYRHLKKGIKNGTLDPNLVNFYDELSYTAPTKNI